MTNDKSVYSCINIEHLDRMDPENRVLLVVFNGNIGERATRQGPFFLGEATSRRVNLPLVSIADPSVTRDQQLSLGWNLGHEDWPTFLQDVAAALNSLSNEHDARLLLFGGSGGGFSVLNVLKYLTCSYDIVAMNPQTTIEGYISRFVADFIRSAYPSLAEKVEDRMTRKYMRDLLRGAGISHDVTRVNGAPGKVLIIQNRADWHVAQHTTPLMMTGRWEQISPRSFLCRERSIAVWFGSWSDGHEPAPAQVSDHPLRLLLKPDADLASVAIEMDRRFKGNDASEFCFDGAATPQICKSY